MKKRRLLLLCATGVVLAVAVLAAPRGQPRLLLLERAARAAADTPPPPCALLLEMGMRDLRARDWSGRATILGAKVVHREGYRFRPGDRVTSGEGWQAGSHRGLMVPPNTPQISKMEPIASVGIVWHLADVTPEARLIVSLSDGSPKETIALKEVLAGATIPLWKGAAELRLISTATPVVTGKTEDDYPAAAYGPDGTLWVAYTSYTLRDESRRLAQAAYREPPENFKTLYHPGFADQLFAKNYKDGRWSEPIAVTGPQEDLGRCAVAVEGDGTVWVMYSANRQGAHQLYERALVKGRLGQEQRLTHGSGGSLNPVVCTLGTGEVLAAHQDWYPSGRAGIGLSRAKPGLWKPGEQKAPGTVWHPDLAVGPRGECMLGYDLYRDGRYSVYVRPVEPKVIDSEILVAGSSKFQARPSLAYDPKGRLWIAYEEGPEQWGKDYGALVPNKGNPLYNARSIKVVCLENGKLFKPAAELPASRHAPVVLPVDPQKIQNYEGVNSRYAYARLGIDGKGRVWLTYRENFGSRYTTIPGTYWLTFARLDGDHWSGPIELHHSDGLLDSRPVLLPHPSGGLLVIHNTDGRYTTPLTVNNDIFQSYVDLPGEPIEPVLLPHDPGRPDEELVKQARKEEEDVQRIRAYRVQAAGKQYQLLRGEFHRHTEISWDGGGDGSLEDMFRYAIDAAAMDWIGNGDHDNGAGREYSWWLIQKFSDAYLVAGRFTPMFTYERSVVYPNGHRNCMFAKRGVMPLPRLAPRPGEQPVGGVAVEDTKMLYRYLREMDGICAVHTSATSMGTDWRDNDPLVEPIVEIYQGDRMSYEVEGAPRAGYDPKTGAYPANVAGWFPKGYVNRALEKGYRLGFQASSDHWSTHISFFVVLAERNERAAILDAVKKRHCYGATDNIVVDWKSGDHLMGDEFTTDRPASFQFIVLGTNRLAKIDILKNSKVVHTIRPQGGEHRGTWTAPAAAGETHYYYLRVEQADGELAWASPMWVRQTR